MTINSTIFLKLANQQNFTMLELLKKIPNTKVSKGLTYLDVIAFHHYVQARKFKCDISNEEITTLSKESGGCFLNSALSLLLKKMNISENIRPRIRYWDLKDDTLAANCDLYRSRINVNKSQKTLNVWHQLSTIRHELEHWKEFIDLLRCDITSNYIKSKTAFVMTLWKNKITYVDERNKDYVKSIWDNRAHDKIFQKYYTKQEKYQKKLIKYLGKIDSNSPEAQNCLNTLNELNHFNIINSNKINYMCSQSENNAHICEYTLFKQLSNPKDCLFKYFKQLNKDNLNLMIEQENENKENYTECFKKLLNTQKNPIISFLGF